MVTSPLKYAKTFASFDSVEKMLLNGFDSFPKSFVIKCNHGCGYNYIVYDKSKIDINRLRQVLQQWINEDYWKKYIEYQYRYIPKKIFIEEYIENITETYKFYCFNGKPKFYYISSDKNGKADYYIDFYDINNNHLDISFEGHENCPNRKILSQDKLQMLISIAAQLSKEFPFVRVDLYNRDSDIYFSELTFLPTGGYMKISPVEYQYQWGDLLRL